MSKTEIGKTFTVKYPTGTEVKKRTNFDSMWLSAKLPSGASIKFTVNRNGETLQVAFSNDGKTSTLQGKVLMNWLKFRKNEDNEQRLDRLEKLLASCKSGAEVITKLPTA